MARIIAESGRTPLDPGDVLVQLLDFADFVSAAKPQAAEEPLAFPVMSRLPGVEAQG